MDEIAANRGSCSFGGRDPAVRTASCLGQVSWQQIDSSFTLLRLSVEYWSPLLTED